MARYGITRHLVIFITACLASFVLYVNLPKFCHLAGIVYWPAEHVVCADESCKSIGLTRDLLEFNINRQLGHVMLPISMKSRIEERAMRDVIRSTWGVAAAKHGMAVVFYVGTGNRTEEEDLALELAGNHDIIQIKFEDVYEHQSIKELVILATERRLFPDVQIYAHVDTDVAVIPANLLQVYRNITAEEHLPSMFGIKLFVKNMTLKNQRYRWTNIDESVFAKNRFDIIWGASLLIDARAVQMMLSEARIVIAKKCAWASDFFLGYLASATGILMTQTAGFNVRDYILRKQQPDSVTDIVTSHKWTADDLKKYFGPGQN